MKRLKTVFKVCIASSETMSVCFSALKCMFLPTQMSPYHQFWTIATRLNFPNSGESPNKLAYFIRGHEGQNSTETRCRGFLVLESRCRGFSVLESHVVAFRLLKKCLGFLVLESRCRGICVSTASFSFSLNLLCHIINIHIVNQCKSFCVS